MNKNDWTGWWMSLSSQLYRLIFTLVESVKMKNMKVRDDDLPMSNV